MVPFRMRGAQRAAGKDDEMVLSGLSEEVGGWGWWRGEGREEEVRGYFDVRRAEIEWCAFVCFIVILSTGSEGRAERGRYGRWGYEMHFCCQGGKG